MLKPINVLILGANGMLGHKLAQVLSKQYQIYVTSRSYPKKQITFLDAVNFIDNVSAENIDSIIQSIKISKPQCVINCIGIVKQQKLAKDPLSSISVNSLFPHRLAQICQAANIRLIHISTDCVFSGSQGNYRETDFPDADDLYGRTKLLGEVGGEACLTIRTSIIGRELESSHGLIEWFLAQQGKTIKGYQKAIFSGFTTLALANIISTLITDFLHLSGLYHVASEPISKYDLLNLVKQVYQVSVNIEPDNSVKCDRSLNPEKFKQATDIHIPSWQTMIQQMYQDTTPYNQLRGDLC